MKKITLLISISLLTNLAIGQTKFENKKLALIQNIFYNTTKQNINSFMKEEGFSDPEIEKGLTDDGELLYFTSKFNTIEIEYFKNNKILSIDFTYAGSLNNVFIEIELEEKGYKDKIVKYKRVDGAEQEKKIWSRSDSKYSFYTLASESDKIGMVGYGIFKE